MSAIDRIAIQLLTCGRRPCIRSLRVRVKDVLELLGAGAERDNRRHPLCFLVGSSLRAAISASRRWSSTCAAESAHPRVALTSPVRQGNRLAQACASSIVRYSAPRVSRRTCSLENSVGREGPVVRRASRIPKTRTGQGQTCGASSDALAANGHNSRKSVSRSGMACLDNGGEMATIKHVLPA